MKATDIAQLFKHTPQDGAPVLVRGWVRTLRDSKAFAFIEVNDGSAFRNLQVVCDTSLPNFEAVTKFTLYSAIEVRGKLVYTPDMKQPFEIKAEAVTVLGASDGSCCPDGFCPGVRTCSRGVRLGDFYRWQPADGI